MEVKKVLKGMKLKVIHNNLAPTRTGGIPLTDNTLASYDQHLVACIFSVVILKTYHSQETSNLLLTLNKSFFCLRAILLATRFFSSVNAFSSIANTM
jgi:hypothetical protein